MTVHDRVIPETLTWREWVTVMRLRNGWTKADLADKVGCSRTWLWRALECDPSSDRYVELSEDFKLRVEETLANVGATQDA